MLRSSFPTLTQLSFFLAKSGRAVNDAPLRTEPLLTPLAMGVSKQDNVWLPAGLPASALTQHVSLTSASAMILF